MDKIRTFLDEHIHKILIALISVVSLIFIIIIFTLAIGENGSRSLIVTEVSGGVFVEKNDGRIPAVRNMKISSGDIIVTEKEGNIKLKTDRGKYIYIEPTSTVYINYTSKAEKGSIIVNISDGAVLCRLDNKLSSKASFEVRTPNSVADVTGTIFHTRFDYHENFGGFDNVMLTSYRCIEGNVLLSLYDPEGNQSDVPVTLLEGNAAELMSSSGFTGYNCTNQPYALTEFSADTLRSLINISGSRAIPYTLNELNTAYVTACEREQVVTEPVITVPETSASYSFETADTPVYGTLPPVTERTLRETEPVTSESDTETAVASSESIQTDTSSDTTAATEETSYNSYVFTEPEITVFTVPTSESDGIITASSDTSDTTESDSSGSLSDTDTDADTESTVTTAVPWWEIVNSGTSGTDESQTENTEKTSETQTEQQSLSESETTESTLTENTSITDETSSDISSSTGRIAN